MRLYTIGMLSDENASALKDWADESRRLETARRENNARRDKVICHALKIGATVAEVVRLTGLTRARVYQIRGDGG